MLGLWLFQILVLLIFITLFAFLLGEYMAKVYAGEPTFLSPILNPIEKFLYKIFGIDPTEDMSWKTFALNFLLFISIGIVILFLLLRSQAFLPLNPEKFQNIKWDSALNTAISFVTNTNWLAYSSEANLSYLTRILGTNLQNFLSAAAGMTVAIALINSFIKKNTEGVGNFWVYLTKSIIHILLPLAIILAIFFISQGTPDNLQPYIHATTLEGKEQIIAQGPAASQIAIKQLGTNGGGFFAANSAHPYENPNPLTDLINILALLVIAAAFPITFGALIKDRVEGWAIFTAMMLLFIISLACVLWSESHGNPLFAKLGIQNGLSMEGKEVRLGTEATIAFANAATATTAGATSSSYTSLMPLTGLVLIFNMAIGEVIFGGVGAGFLNMMFYIILTMFLVGLMIGRSPEIYGKKLDAHVMLLTIIALFIPNIFQLFFSALAISIDSNIMGLINHEFHGISEIFYAYTSGIGNNGSAFTGFNANTTFYNLTMAFVMLLGYLAKNISGLAVAGAVIRKNSSPPATRFPTTGLIFILVVIMIILFIGTLAFLPILVLGPVLEHMTLLVGKVY